MLMGKLKYLNFVIIFVLLILFLWVKYSILLFKAMLKIEVICVRASVRIMYIMYI